MNKRTISNRVFLDLLETQPYDAPVQSVIYSALEYYFNLKKNDQTFGSYVSYCIKQRIREKAIDENDTDGYLFDHQEAKRILIEELTLKSYPEWVERVFFWALKAFCVSKSVDDDEISKKEKEIAKQIIETILVAERRLMN